MTSGVSEAQGSGPKGGAGVQDFVRTTRKYWVATEDVSMSSHRGAPPGVPHGAREGSVVASAGRLPDDVLLYLDNVNLGLYHNRITKHPHSIAVRLRWYGTDPENGKVFVERKTHRDSWTGEESVKERFILPRSLPPAARGAHLGRGGTAPSRRVQDKGEEGWRAHDQRAAGQHQETLQRGAARGGVQTAPAHAPHRLHAHRLSGAVRRVGEMPPRHLACDGGGEPQGRHLVSDVRSLVSRPSSRFIAPSRRDFRTSSWNEPAPARREAPSQVSDLISGALTEVHKFSKFMPAAVLFPDVAHEVPHGSTTSPRQSIQSAADATTGATRQYSRDRPGGPVAASVPHRRRRASFAGSEPPTLSSQTNTTETVDWT